MIVTDLAHAAEQLPSPRMQKALAYLRGIGANAPADGRVDIEGDQLFALVQSYETAAPAAEPAFEAHKKYIDIQYVASGEEIIGWLLTDALRTTIPYTDAKDAWFGVAQPGATMTPVYLKAGQLAVFYPSDGHAPKLAAAKPGTVKKIVVKVMI
jgi:biofilm protein TabA